MLRAKRKTAHRFFENGWGDPSQLSALKQYSILEAPVAPPKVVLKRVPTNGAATWDGSFATPFPSELLPEATRVCHFRLISPREEFRAGPVCVVFAMTGDQGYGYRTRAYTEWLLSKNIATLLIENPFYGLRRPEYQKSFHFVTVADMLAMALAAVEEGKAVIEWLKSEGCPEIGVAGVSQAAMIAGAVGAVVRHPIAVACSLVAHSAEVILCDGLLRKFVDWNAIAAGDFSETRYRLIETFRGTDLTRLPRPSCPRATLLQGAFYDLVSPRYSVRMIHRQWPGSRLHWLPGTHLTSLGLHKRSVCRLIAASFGALRKSEPSPVLQ